MVNTTKHTTFPDSFESFDITDFNWVNSDLSTPESSAIRTPSPPFATHPSSSTVHIQSQSASQEGLSSRLPHMHGHAWSPSTSVTDGSPKSSLGPLQQPSIIHTQGFSSESEPQISKPQPRIPRPPNAFILFRCDLVKNGQMPIEVGSQQQRKSRVAGKRWRMLSDEVRTQWEDKAKEMKKLHKKRYPDYVYRPTPSKKKRAAPSKKAVSECRSQNGNSREMEVRSTYAAIPGPSSRPSRKRKDKEAHCVSTSGRASRAGAVPTPHPHPRYSPDSHSPLAVATASSVASFPADYPLESWAPESYAGQTLSSALFPQSTQMFAYEFTSFQYETQSIFTGSNALEEALIPGGADYRYETTAGNSSSSSLVEICHDLPKTHLERWLDSDSLSGDSST